METYERNTNLSNSIKGKEKEKSSSESQDDDSILPSSPSETSIFSSVPSSPTYSNTATNIPFFESSTSTITLKPKQKQPQTASNTNNKYQKEGGSTEEKKPISLNSVVFGNFTRDNEYSIEYDLNLVDGVLYYDKKEACIVIEGKKSTSTIRILFSLDSFKSLILDQEHLHFDLAYAPYYYNSDQQSSNLQTTFFRSTPFDADHKRIAPFASCRIRIEFSSPLDRENFLRNFKLIPLPLIRERSIASTIELKLYSAELLDRFKKGLKGLNISHAFHLEAILYDGLLPPYELELLQDRIIEIIHRRGKQSTEKVLIELRRLLGEERKKRDNVIGEDSNHASSNSEGAVSDPFDLLFQAESNVKETENLDRDKNLFSCYHLFVSPTSYYMLGPVIETGNSIMRKYEGNEENFLRVSFVEEDQTKLQMNRNGVNRLFLEQFVTRALDVGLDLNGRTYQFLSYSKASQKAHSVWSLSPFSTDSSILPITSDTVIRNLGSFEKIRYQPTLLGSRISQAFTASQDAGWIHKEDVLMIDDIISIRDNGIESVHTDGAGTMSLEVRNQICETLKISTLPLPTVLQVRIAGAKGLLVLDVTLQGFKIGLRPSMKKFDGALDHEGIGYKINVAQTFTKLSKLFFNRPLISALDDLGISKERFLDLQESVLDQIEKNTSTLSSIRGLLDRYSLGKSLGDLIESLTSSIAVDDLKEDVTIQLYLAIAKQKIRNDIKYLARIEVPSGLQLVGVPDLDGFLKKDEVYICIDSNGEKVVREGIIVITRSPTVDPSDIRIVKAVRIPKGQAERTTALTNCVVLPTTGKRSLSSMMSGGDLDGDLYQLIPLQNFIPTTPIPEEEVLEHEGDSPKRLDRPANLNDIAKNVVDFMEKDVIGIIGTEHLKTADRFTGKSPTCRKLAELYSKAVDYSKSGVEIPFHQIPKRSYLKGPDFLPRQSSIYMDTPMESYYSLRVLGYLFRAVPDSKDKASTFETPKDYTTSLLPLALNKIRTYTTQKEIDSNKSIHTSIATAICRTFLSNFLRCATVYNFPRRPGRNLSEAETYMGTITAVPSREADKKGRYESSSELQEQITILLDEINKLVQTKRNLGQQILLWLACWETGLSMSNNEFGVASFKWTCIGGFFETLGMIERKGWEWQQVNHPSKAEAEKESEPSSGLTVIPSVTTTKINQPVVVPNSSSLHSSSNQASTWNQNQQIARIAQKSRTPSPSPSPPFPLSPPPPVLSTQVPKPPILVSGGWGKIPSRSILPPAPLPPLASTSTQNSNFPPNQRSIPSPAPVPVRIHGFRAVKLRNPPPSANDNNLPEIVPGIISQPINSLNIIEEPELILPKGRPKYLKDRASERERRRIAAELAVGSRISLGSSNGIIDSMSSSGRRSDNGITTNSNYAKSEVDSEADWTNYATSNYDTGSNFGEGRREVEQEPSRIQNTPKPLFHQHYHGRFDPPNQYSSLGNPPRPLRSYGYVSRWRDPNVFPLKDLK